MLEELSPIIESAARLQWLADEFTNTNGKTFGPSVNATNYGAKEVAEQFAIHTTNVSDLDRMAYCI